MGCCYCYHQLQSETQCSMASLPPSSLPNLFSSLPQTPPPPSPSPSSASFPTPIPIPKYPPPRRHKPTNNNNDDAANRNTTTTSPAFKSTHRGTKFYKPVKDGVISSDGDRAVIVGESGVSYLLPGAPFHFQYSYSETPKTKPLAIREPAFLPFAPPTMSRPWTGKAPLKKKKDKNKSIRLFRSEDDDGDDVVVDDRRLEMARSAELGRNMMKRNDVLGEPLRKWEIKMLIKPYLNTNKQVNLGRDGLTHNMLELVHSHWRRQEVCKVRCLGVPTVDMNNVCWHLEKKTGGKIIYRIGGVVYLYRGRNYDHCTRPQFPIMLWKPASPVYPKLIQDAPEGLTKLEADELRMKGKRLIPICKLAKNGVYVTLVKDVRHAFEGSSLVKIDCTGMHATDYKKLGAKLKDLVPCTLLSFDDEQILMWRGQSWKSMYTNDVPTVTATREMGALDVSGTKKSIGGSKISPKMMLLWKRAIASDRALLLDELNLDPDELLEKVERFEGISQTPEHSYPAILVNESDLSESKGEFGGSHLNEESDQESSDDDDFEYDTDEVESSVPLGSLPIDHLAERLNWNHSDEFM